MKKLHKAIHLETNEVFMLFWCSGCACAHKFKIEGPGRNYDFNGNMDKPTFIPSLAVYAEEPSKRCHLNLINGKIHYTPDCFHKLRGCVVELEDW